MQEIARLTGWELSHFLASQSSRVLGAAAFCFFAGLLMVRNQWGYVLGTTALGQLAELVYDLMLIFGLILPFLVTDQVAHDYQERMHELLMTTAVSSRIYVLSRYLAALLISLGLAILLLAAQLLVNLVLPALNTWLSIRQSADHIFLMGPVGAPRRDIDRQPLFLYGDPFPAPHRHPQAGNLHGVDHSGAR